MSGWVSPRHVAGHPAQGTAEAISGQHGPPPNLDERAGRAKCAFPPCDRTVPAPEPGRPPRRFCSVEHRVRAHGQAGALPRSGQPTTQQPRADRASTPALAWPGFMHPEEHRRPTHVSRDGGRSGLPPVTQRPDWRRLAVAMAAAGILVAGVGLTSSSDGRGSPPHLAGPTDALPLDLNAAWETRAAVTLAALQHQLAVIAETEVAWTDDIAQQYEDTPTPRAVLEMLEAKEQLQRQITALEAQLDSVDRLRAVREQAVATEIQLAAVDEAIGQDGPPPGQDMPDDGHDATDEATDAALRAQRELLAASLATQRVEEANLEQGVEAAREAPLPDSNDNITPLVQEVLDLDRSDDTPPAGTSVIAQGRDPDSEPTPQTTTTGPDDPSDEDIPPNEDTGNSTDEQRQGGPPVDTSTADADDTTPGGDGAGPVDDVVGAVDDAVTGGAGDGSGPVDDVVGAVDDVVTGGAGDGSPLGPRDDGPAPGEPGRDDADDPGADGSGPTKDLVGAVDGLLGDDGNADEPDTGPAPRVDRDGGRAGERDDLTTALGDLLDSGEAGTDGDDEEAAATLALDLIRSVPGAQLAAPWVEAALANAAGDPDGDAARSEGEDDDEGGGSGTVNEASEDADALGADDRDEDHSDDRGELSLGDQGDDSAGGSDDEEDVSGDDEEEVSGDDEEGESGDDGDESW